MSAPAAASAELAELARQSFNAHIARKCADASAECGWYRGQFAVMVRAGSAHKSEWHSFMECVRACELERERERERERQRERKR